MTTEYEMCEHGRHIGAVCLPCAEKEMIYDKALETGVADYYNPEGPSVGYVDGPGGLEYVDPFDIKKEPVDEVNNPKHYTVGGYEAIDVIRAKLTPEEYIGGLKWQILKYTMRANYKGHHDQDCEKATWYANELVDFLQKQRDAKSVDKKG